MLAPVRMLRANEEQDHFAHEATSAPAQLGPQEYIAGFQHYNPLTPRNDNPAQADHVLAGDPVEGSDPRRHRRGSGAVFEAKFMLPWSFSEVAAAEKCQHNMWVANAKLAVLSVITGGAKWVEIAIPADPLYQHLLLTAEKKFWRCVESGEPPRLFGIKPPRPRIEAVRIVDMRSSNSWAEFAALYRESREAYVAHERAKIELKPLVPEGAREAFGHGIRARRRCAGSPTRIVWGPL